MVFTGGAGDDDAADGSKVQWTVLDVAKLTSGGPATCKHAGFLQQRCGGLVCSGGFGVPCASAKRSRLLEVFDDCLYVGRRLSPHDRAVFAFGLLETGGIGYSKLYEKVGYSILSNDLSSPARHRFHSVISDFRPPSGIESGEPALRRLLASRATGGYLVTSDDPAPGSLTVFQSTRVARPQDASKNY